MAPDRKTDGNKFVSFSASNLNPNGSIPQAFPTTVGSKYTLTVDAALIKFNDTYQTLEARISGSSNLLSKIVTLTGIENGSVHWVRYSLNL